MIKKQSREGLETAGVQPGSNPARGSITSKHRFSCSQPNHNSKLSPNSTSTSPIENVIKTPSNLIGNSDSEQRKKKP